MFSMTSLVRLASTTVTVLLLSSCGHPAQSQPAPHFKSDTSSLLSSNAPTLDSAQQQQPAAQRPNDGTAEINTHHMKILRILGLPIQSDEVIAFFVENRCRESIVTEGYYRCEASGMTVVTQSWIVMTVHLEQEGGGYQQYEGRLPYGLEWRDDKAAIYKKIGNPDDVDEYGEKYDDLGLFIKYKENNKLATVVVFNPER